MSLFSTLIWLNEFLNGETFEPFGSQLVYSYFSFVLILSFYSLWTCRHDLQQTSTNSNVPLSQSQQKSTKKTQ